MAVTLLLCMFSRENFFVCFIQMSWQHINTEAQNVSALNDRVQFPGSTQGCVFMAIKVKIGDAILKAVRACIVDIVMQQAV